MKIFQALTFQDKLHFYILQLIQVYIFSTQQIIAKSNLRDKGC